MNSLTPGVFNLPNDTYIMAALAEGRIPSSVDFRITLADVETLNQWALERRLDVTKLSFMALGRVRDHYGLLKSGAALVWGCGPLLVARPGTGLDRLSHGVVAAPGALDHRRTPVESLSRASSSFPADGLFRGYACRGQR